MVHLRVTNKNPGTLWKNAQNKGPAGRQAFQELCFNKMCVYNMIPYTAIYWWFI